MSHSETSARHVLLAAESRTVALLARALLQRLGCVVHAVGSLEQLHQRLGEQLCDLAVISADSPDAEAMAATCIGDGMVRPIPVLALVTPGHALPGAVIDLALPIDAASLKAAIDQCLATTRTAIDETRIAALWGTTDSPAFRRVAGVFLGELHDRQERIAGLLAAGDLAGVSREAHGVKGAAANVGASAVELAAARLEMRAAQGDAAAVAGLAAGLQAAAGPAADSLQALIGGDPTP